MMTLIACAGHSHGNSALYIMLTVVGIFMGAAIVLHLKEKEWSKSSGK